MSLLLYAGGAPPYPTCCFQFLSAQFSLLNCALTGALTRLASPDAPATVDTPPGPVAAAEGVALADGLALAEALGVGLADALAAAAPSTRARMAISRGPVLPAPAGASAPDFLVAEAEALGLALVVLELLADGDGEEDGVGVGVAVAVFGAIRSTCAEQQLGGLADQVDHLLGARPGHRHGDLVAALLLHLGLGEAGPVHPAGHDVLGLGHVCGELRRRTRPWA